jgi:hypothetical protein
MTERRHFCDRCRSVILADRTVLDTRCGPLRPTMPRIELCADCASLLRNWLRHAEPAAVAATN